MGDQDGAALRRRSRTRCCRARTIRTCGLFPGGPPEPPYDVTGHTLWMLTGVQVDAVAKPFDAPLELVKTVAPMTATVAAQAEGRLSDRARELRHVQDGRAAAEGQRAGLSRVEGASTAELRARHVGDSVRPRHRSRSSRSTARSSASRSRASIRAPAVDGERLKPNTKVGLYKAAGNMPAGWQMWMLEQYGINHEVMKAQDFAGDLNAKYDVIILPSGTTKPRMHQRPQREDATIRRNGRGRSASATPAGRNLKKFVENGGTLLAIGSAVETARDLLDLPIEKALPQAAPRFGKARRGSASRPAHRQTPNRELKDAFSSPARLMQTLRDKVADPSRCSIARDRSSTTSSIRTIPIAWGMPASWPVFFEDDQAYRLRPGFGIETKVVSRYPREKVLAERMAARRGIPARTRRTSCRSRSARATSSPMAARSISARSRARRGS